LLALRDRPVLPFALERRVRAPFAAFALRRPDAIDDDDGDDGAGGGDGGDGDGGAGGEGGEPAAGGGAGGGCGGGGDGGAGLLKMLVVVHGSEPPEEEGVAWPVDAPTPGCGRRSESRDEAERAAQLEREAVGGILRAGASDVIVRVYALEAGGLVPGTLHGGASDGGGLAAGLAAAGGGLAAVGGDVADTLTLGALGDGGAEYADAGGGGGSGGAVAVASSAACEPFLRVKLGGATQSCRPRGGKAARAAARGIVDDVPLYTVAEVGGAIEMTCRIRI
jgi:hypothetical protein